MIYLSFALSNPWSKQEFDHLWLKNVVVTENKTIELELYKTKTIIGGSFGLTFRQDHAGLDFSIDLVGYTFSFSLIDNRHWNSKINDWENWKTFATTSQENSDDYHQYKKYGNGDHPG